jgi:Arm DNA-binding domain
MPKINLTDRKLKSLKAARAGDRYELLDQLVPGFGVRVTDKGPRTFILKTRYPGSRHPTRRALGEYGPKHGELTLEEAREKAREWLSKKGFDPAHVEEEKRQAKLRVVKLLESIPRFKGATYVFSADGGKNPIHANALSKPKGRLDDKILRTLRAFARKRGDDPRRATLPDWVNHDLRRTVRSNLSALRIAEEAREAVLAHARPGIKGTYDLYDYKDEKLEALELWAARLRAIVQPPPANVVDLAKARA